MDSKIDVPTHGPMVKSQRYDLEEISKFRSDQVEKMIESGEVNDFNLKQVTSKEIEKVQSEVLKSKEKSPKVKSQSKIKAT